MGITPAGIAFVLQDAVAKMDPFQMRCGPLDRRSKILAHQRQMSHVKFEPEVIMG